MDACFIAYIVQAIINNFVPLLFLRFQEDVYKRQSMTCVRRSSSSVMQK